jgi:hypothetical protein
MRGLRHSKENVLYPKIVYDVSMAGCGASASTNKKRDV